MIEEILQKSTVGLSSTSKKYPTGTGFYILPNTILTCAHCVTENKEPFEYVSVYQNDAKYIGAVDKEAIDFDSDLALIKIDEIDQHPCVRFDDSLRVSDPLWAFGFSRAYPSGDSVLLEYEGPSESEQYGKLEKLKGGQIPEGLSGAAILNRITGGVCGVLKLSRDINKPYGGRFISLHEVFVRYPWLKERSLEWNKENREWEDILAYKSIGIGIDDRTQNEDHFLLFLQDPVRIEDIWVEPRFDTITYYNYAPTQNEGSDAIQFARKAIEEQGLLFVTGGYGVGKSIFLKMLQKSIINEGQDTVFLEFRDVGNIEKHKFLALIKERKQRGKSLLLIFDGFDEINYYKKDKLEITGQALKNAITATKLEGIHVVISSRNTLNIGMDLYDLLVLEASGLTTERNFVFLQLHHFRKSQIKNWLIRYGDAINKREKREDQLLESRIKKTHKNLMTSVHNPLLLYMVNLAYYQLGKDSLGDIYETYEKFVDSTVLGKFSLYKKESPEAIKEIASKYRIFLKEMAITIAKER